MSKDLFLLHGEISSPPMSVNARRESGYLLRQLQDGETFFAPVCKPMRTIGQHCYELRITDEDKRWRIMAARMGSAQSRVAKMESGSADTSFDLLIKGLLAAGATPSDIGKVLAKVSLKKSSAMHA